MIKCKNEEPILYYMRCYFKLIDLIVCGNFKECNGLSIQEIREMVEVEIINE